MSTPPAESTTVETTDSSYHTNPLVGLFLHYLDQFLSLCAQFLGLKPSHFHQQGDHQQPPEQNQPPAFVTEFLEWFAFDDFQLKLLKGFSIVLFCNVLFISLAWNYYGQRISDKLMRPGMFYERGTFFLETKNYLLTATSKSILELKKSVSQLKLPTEHTPRI